MYPGAFFFSEASSAYVFMIVVNMFFGVTATVTTFILQLFPDDVVRHEILSFHFMLLNCTLGKPLYLQGIQPAVRLPSEDLTNLQLLSHLRDLKWCGTALVLS